MLLVAEFQCLHHGFELDAVPNDVEPLFLRLFRHHGVSQRRRQAVDTFRQSVEESTFGG
jgi:hypothetical protein